MPRKPLPCLRRGYGRSLKGRRRKVNGAQMRPYGERGLRNREPEGRHLAPVGPDLQLGAALPPPSAAMPKSAQPQGGEQDTRPAPAGARPKGLRRSPPGGFPRLCRGWPKAFRAISPHPIPLQHLPSPHQPTLTTPPAPLQKPTSPLPQHNVRQKPKPPGQPHKISVNGNSPLQGTPEQPPHTLHQPRENLPTQLPPPLPLMEQKQERAPQHLPLLP